MSFSNPIAFHHSQALSNAVMIVPKLTTFASIDFTFMSAQNFKETFAYDPRVQAFILVLYDVTSGPTSRAINFNRSIKVPCQHELLPQACVAELQIIELA
eukprot:gnl/MRDRNA2_/MRDRNA2_373418_c0_seq1.p1 gnl/MRDRNA2_/MRDRNA2_373418_c0~~gnl/MRDRNA2_/MRDRNA2_373418_c0_seq1.p1  ORF type:complete len:100 (-),score=10.51 gnl/MRDRNA2_/MRDRNA2_373418_c0_seq1:10-309(-)